MDLDQDAKLWHRRLPKRTREGSRTVQNLQLPHRIRIPVMGQSLRHCDTSRRCQAFTKDDGAWLWSEETPSRTEQTDELIIATKVANCSSEQLAFLGH